ncbi:unnamed protein product [Closterium sp. Yama58-4]|nr:unnamed protein product [Closterium sp. Yama58-4]
MERQLRRRPVARCAFSLRLCSPPPVLSPVLPPCSPRALPRALRVSRLALEVGCEAYKKLLQAPPLSFQCTSHRTSPDATADVVFPCSPPAPHGPYVVALEVECEAYKKLLQDHDQSSSPMLSPVLFPCSPPAIPVHAQVALEVECEAYKKLLQDHDQSSSPVLSPVHFPCSPPAIPVHAQVALEVECEAYKKLLQDHDQSSSPVLSPVLFPCSPPAIPVHAQVALEVECEAYKKLLQDHDQSSSPVLSPVLFPCSPPAILALEVECEAYKKLLQDHDQSSSPVLSPVLFPCSPPAIPVHAQVALEVECEAYKKLLQDHFTDTSNQIRLLANLMTTFHYNKPQGTLDRATFMGFLNDTQYARPRLRDVSFAASVPRAERGAFERAQGSGFCIKHDMACAEQQSDYAPILYTTSSHELIGQDMLWDAFPANREAVIRARDQGVMGALTPPLQMAVDSMGGINVGSSSSTGASGNTVASEASGNRDLNTLMLRIYPVYQERTPPDAGASVAEFRSKCRGFMSAVIDFEPLIKSLHREHMPMLVRVYDVTNGSSEAQTGYYNAANTAARGNGSSGSTTTTSGTTSSMTSASGGSTTPVQRTDSGTSGNTSSNSTGGSGHVVGFGDTMAVPGEVLGRGSVERLMYEPQDHRLAKGQSDKYNYVTTMDLGDPYRQYEIRCRYLDYYVFPYSSLGWALVIVTVMSLLGYVWWVASSHVHQLEHDFHRMELLKDKMKAARNVAERASKAKGTFLATMSHELRTPMNGVIGMLNLLLETPLTITQLDYVETARTSGRALLELINDILDLSKIEAQKMQLERVPMDVRVEVDTVLTMFIERFRDKPLLQVAAYVDPLVPAAVLGDSLRLRQVLINLLSNACKFTERGHIFVAIRTAEPDEDLRKLTLSGREAVDSCNSWVVLGARRDKWREEGMRRAEKREGKRNGGEGGTGDGGMEGERGEEGEGSRKGFGGGGSPLLNGPIVRLVISVEDTGEGIPYPAQRTILKPFMQADASTTRTHGGTGIGLSISRHLVDLMGGKLSFTSRPGVGTTFFFDVVMPCDSRDASPLHLLQLTEASLSQFSAILLDDRPVRFGVMESLLNRLGIPVLNTPEAVAEPIVRIPNPSSLLTAPAAVGAGVGKRPVIVVVDEEWLGRHNKAVLQHKKKQSEGEGQGGQEGQEGEEVREVQEGQEVGKKRARKEGERCISSSSCTWHWLAASAMAEAGYEAAAGSPSSVPPALPSGASMRKESDGARLLCQALKGKRILVVDDNMVNRKVMARMLQRYGVDVETVDGGAKAVKAVQQATTRFDCVFMDVQMPEMDGLEATGLIRKYEAGVRGGNTQKDRGTDRLLAESAALNVVAMPFFEARRAFDRALASDTWTDPVIVTRAVRRQLGLTEPAETASVSAKGNGAAASAGEKGTQGEIENAAEMLEQTATSAVEATEKGTQGEIENAAEMLEQVATGAASFGRNGTKGEIESAAEMLEQIATGAAEATASNGAGVEASDGEASGWPLRSQTVQTAYHNSPDGATNNSNSAAPADPPPTEALPPSAAAPAKAPESHSQPQPEPEPRLTHEQYSGLAEGTEMEKVVAARVRDTEGMLEALRSAAGSSYEDMALHREESRAHPEAFGHRDWRLKEQSKSHRVMYRPGAEGTAFHELCLEGVLKGSLDTVLAVAWEAPFFIDWWPQFSVPPFHVLESKFVKRVAPGYELVYVRFKVPWPFAQRDILYVLFSVHDAATGFIATSLISFPEDPGAFDPDSYGFTNDGVPRVRSGEVRMRVKGGFAAKDLGNGHCYFRGVATIDMQLNLIPSWLINFVSRQLAGSGYHMLYNEIESVADGSNKEADKFRALLLTDPFYYSVGRAMRSHRAAAAVQSE